MEISPETLPEIAIAIALGYLAGSIPFGLLLARLAGAGDVRKIGSGNIGATNVLRTGRKSLAALTLLLDMGKGLVAVWLAGRLGTETAAALALLAAVVGHCFPIWLGFRGGKGVATLAGACLALDWRVGLAYALAWLAVLAATRISSLAGMSAPVVAVLGALWLGRPVAAGVLVLAAALVIFLHRANIARLLRGEEPRVGAGR